MEDQVEVPLEKAWEWAKPIGNQLSAMSQIRAIEEKSDLEARIEVDLGLRVLPKQIVEAESKTVEVNEEEKYTRSITKGEIFDAETFIKLESISENETKVSFYIKGEFKGWTGRMLERAMKAMVQRRLDEALGEYCWRMEQQIKRG